MSVESHEFRVGWSGFQKDLLQGEGFLHFMVVDDYTCKGIWDRLYTEGPAKIGTKPEAFAHISGVPVGRWCMYNVIHPHYSAEWYELGGIFKPRFEDLPAVFAMREGKEFGKYAYWLQYEDALSFMISEIAQG